MTSTRLLIANRGEIAIRIIRAAAELGLESVAVYSEDDAESLHIRKADDAVALQGGGVAAYLDDAQIIAKAVEAKCTLIHPGYGFLSEDAAFAKACAEAGLTFVGPTPDTLELFGNKVAARRLAELRRAPTDDQGRQLPVMLVTATALPLVNAALALALAVMLGLGEGDALLLLVLAASASYIAVPAAMRLALPEANPGRYLSMSLAITFPFNLLLGIPLYHAAVRWLQ